MRPARWRVYVGDVTEQLRKLPDQKYHCVVTSPPYWQQRNYGVPGQLGLEPTLDDYIVALVAVFRELRRVLRDDGTFWLNIGDKYAAGKNAGARGQDKMRRTAGPRGPRIPGLTGQLLGVPWRLAFALQADGWQLRRDVIWSKPNPMPESTKMRPMTAHEYLFIFSKTPKYHFDPYAIMEPVSGGAHSRGTGLNPKAKKNPKSKLSGRANAQYSAAMSGKVLDFRLPRSVWTVATFSFRGSHFATYPPKLIERVLKGATSEAGCCPDCGMPWKRTVLRERYATRPGRNNKQSKYENEVPPAGWTGPNRIGNKDKERHETRYTTLGFKPGCGCRDVIASIAAVDRPVVPCRVLDPFLGSGTTAMVAQRLGLDCDGIEISREYAALSVRRVTADAQPKQPKPRKRKRA